MMPPILVGSRAMGTHFADARTPYSGDWDYYVSEDYQKDIMEKPSHARVDVFSDKRLEQWHWDTLNQIATPSELYTIKISHSYWEINRSPRNWDKHASDIIFLSRKGSTFLPALHSLLLPIWKERYDNRKRVSLDKTGKEFFSDAVNRIYDHDSLHESVAYYDRPLYERFLKDGSEVLSDWDKFEALGHDLQIQAVREEIYATALERILIPGNYSGSPGAAYWWALRRTATSLFKNQWATFLMLNLDELRRPDCRFMLRHLENKHRLRPYMGD